MISMDIFVLNMEHYMRTCIVLCCTILEMLEFVLLKNKENGLACSEPIRRWIRLFSPIYKFPYLFYKKQQIISLFSRNYFPHISIHALFLSCTSASVNFGLTILLIVSSPAFACISCRITSRLVLLICPEL